MCVCMCVCVCVCVCGITTLNIMTQFVRTIVVILNVVAPMLELILKSTFFSPQLPTRLFCLTKFQFIKKLFIRR